MVRAVMPLKAFTDRFWEGGSYALLFAWHKVDNGHEHLDKSPVTTRLTESSIRASILESLGSKMDQW